MLLRCNAVLEDNLQKYKNVLDVAPDWFLNIFVDINMLKYNFKEKNSLMINFVFTRFSIIIGIQRGFLLEATSFILFTKNITINFRNYSLLIYADDTSKKSLKDLSQYGLT